MQVVCSRCFQVTNSLLSVCLLLSPAKLCSYHLILVVILYTESHLAERYQSSGTKRIEKDFSLFGPSFSEIEKFLHH